MTAAVRRAHAALVVVLGDAPGDAASQDVGARVPAPCDRQRAAGPGDGHDRGGLGQAVTEDGVLPFGLGGVVGVDLTQAGLGVPAAGGSAGYPAYRPAGPRAHFLIRADPVEQGVGAHAARCVDRH